MTLRTLCEKHPNEYILVNFWDTSETIDLGSTILKDEAPLILDMEVIAERSEADYYDIYAKVL